MTIVVVLAATISGVILAILSNYLYDLLRLRGFFPDKPTLKKSICILLFFIPFLLLVILPNLIAPPLPQTSLTTPTPSQMQSGSGNIQIGTVGGNVSITTPQPKKEFSLKDCPSFPDIDKTKYRLEVEKALAEASRTKSPAPLLDFYSKMERTGTQAGIKHKFDTADPRCFDIAIQKVFCQFFSKDCDKTADIFK